MINKEKLLSFCCFNFYLLVQVKMSAIDGKKDDAEPNNNNNNNKSVVLETNLDETPTASDSAGGAVKETDDWTKKSIIR